MSVNIRDSVKNELEPHGRFGVSVDLENDYGEVHLVNAYDTEIQDPNELASSIARKLGYQYSDSQSTEDGYLLRMSSGGL